MSNGSSQLVATTARRGSASTASIGCRGTRRPDLSCDAISAQAAIDQTEYVRTGLWIAVSQAVVGFFTLLAAVGAAIFARSASNHTGRGVKEAERAAKAAEETLRSSRDVAHTDLRAWVGIELVLLDAKRTQGAAHFDVEVQIKNVGQTPALRIGVGVHVYIMPAIQVVPGSPPQTQRYRHHMPSLLPGMSAKQGIGERLNNDAIAAGMDAARREGCEPIVFIDAVVAYHTVFDSEDAEPHFTSIRYIVVTTKPDRSDRAGRFRWLETGPEGTDSVSFGQQQGAPIHMS